MSVLMQPVTEGINRFYRRIVARDGKQLWSDDDVKRLQAKVRRLQKGDTDGNRPR